MIKLECNNERVRLVARGDTPTLLVETANVLDGMLNALVKPIPDEFKERYRDIYLDIVTSAITEMDMEYDHGDR